MRTWWSRYSQWWSKQTFASRWQALGVGLATVSSIVYRFAHIDTTMQFFADQGRDAIVAYNIMHGKVAFVGPATSVGNMFLGPLYYYFMAPFLWLAHWNPIGPALAVAVLSVLTVPLLFWVGSKLVGRWPAWFATLLYVSGPYVAEYSRFSWNPNPAPLIMLMLLYAVWRAWRGNVRWWLFVAVCFAILSQLHYVALLAAGPAGLFWLADLVRSVRNNRQRVRPLLLSTLGAIVIVAISFAPLVAFDFRYNHVIWNGFTSFFTQQGGASSVSAMEKFSVIFREQQGRGMQVLFELWGKEWFSGYRQLNITLLFAYAGIALIGWWQYRKTDFREGYILVISTTLFTILGLAFYKSTVFFHYFTFYYPVSYLLTGLVIYLLAKQWGVIGRGVAFILLCYVLWLSVQPTQLLYLKPLSWTAADMQRTTQELLRQIPADKTYGLVLLSDVRDYRGLNYRYFLVSTTHPPFPLETSDKADMLVIIAENPKEARDVLGSPVYEIVVFPKGNYRTYDIPNGPRLYFIERKGT